MKVSKLLCLSLFLLLCELTNAQENISQRETINFNREWKYARGDYKGAEQAGYSDKDWEVVGLPHSFSMPYFMSKDFYVGYGWYRKSFNVSANQLTRKMFLEFDGVFQEAEVFVNGKQIGNHIGGYTGFSIDISPALKVGSNLIAVRVNNNWRSDIAPRAGEHVFSGGIYRNVRLVTKFPVYIDWYGTFVTTPDLAKTKGRSSAVKIVTDVCNRTIRGGDYRLLSEIIDPNGKVVASAETTQRVNGNGTKRFEQTTEIINNPSLWNPQYPSLYKVVSSLYRNKLLVDRDETTFGFRWFEWTADKGFFLNGEHLDLKGANVHQDHAGWGDAVTESALKRDVNMMREAGFNFIRGSHYPHAPAFSRACDEEGMLFWSEAPFWGIGGFKPDGYWDSSAYPVNEADTAAFEASALKQLREMIRIHRNHPSIVAWSMCNEAFFSAPEAMPGVRRLLKKMVDLTHQLDPTRPAAVGGVQRPLGKGRIDLIGDVAGYNGDGSTIADFQNPGIPSIVAEYGSTTADRPGVYEPGWGDLQRNDGWKGFPWRSGQAIWCGFDHGSIAGSQLGKMGIVDYFRIPKRAWYWYRNEYMKVAPPEWPKEGTPARIRLTATQLTDIRADGTDDVRLDITILDAQGKEISNSPAVELTVVSGPGEFPTGSSIRFEKGSDIRIADGKAAIEFRSHYAGNTIIKATSPGLPPAQINLSFVDAPAYIKGKTPTVKERPYIRFVRQQGEEIVQTFGRNNPTFASSSAKGYPAGQAADGDENTWWQPEENDQEVSWMLDTEKGLALRDVVIVFPQVKQYRYKIETSADNVQWKLFYDGTTNTKQMKRQQFTLKEKDKVRFIRVSFPKQENGVLPGIAEVIVKGVVLN